MNVFVFLLVVAYATALPPPPPPSQAQMYIEIESLQIPKKSTYPPRKRIVFVAWDLAGKRSRVQWVRGYEDIDHTIIRRLDLGREYELMNICNPPNATVSTTTTSCIKTCKRSEIIVPSSSRSVLEVDPAWEELDATTTTSSPEGTGDATYTHQLLGDTYVEMKSLRTPTMVYRILNVTIGTPPDESLFLVPHAWKPKEGGCKSVPRNVGFPTQHVFGHYWRL
eukprot:PhF_6_TR30560/c0_g1_i1/m.44892